MRAYITCPLRTIKNVITCTGRWKQNQYSRRPTQNTRFGEDHVEVQRSEYPTTWSSVLLGSQ
jgi:hypothetical protein